MPTDHVICSSPDLLDANDDLVEAWLSVLLAGGTEKREALLEEQRAWMLDLASRCGLASRGRPTQDRIASAQDCIRRGLDERTGELQALLHRQDFTEDSATITPLECDGVKSVIRSICDGHYNCSQVWHVSGKQIELSFGEDIAQSWACASTTVGARIVLQWDVAWNSPHRVVLTPQGKWMSDSDYLLHELGDIEFRPVCRRGVATGCE